MHYDQVRILRIHEYRIKLGEDPNNILTNIPHLQYRIDTLSRKRTMTKCILIEYQEYRVRKDQGLEMILNISAHL